MPKAITSQLAVNYGRTVVAKANNGACYNNPMTKTLSIATLPAPLDDFHLEQKRGEYKDFQLKPGDPYPLKGVTYPVDYGFLPGYVGEDGHELDLFVGSATQGQYGAIVVTRADAPNGEHKFYVGLTAEELAAVQEAFAPVLARHEPLSGVDELLDAIEKFRLTYVSEFRFKLYPKDFQASRHFYEHKLKFPVMNEWDRGEDDRGVMFKVGSAVIELLSPEGPHEAVAGCDLSVRVPSVWVLWEVMKDGDNIIRPLTDNAWGDTSFCIVDPEGLKLTFFSETP